MILSPADAALLSRRHVFVLQPFDRREAMSVPQAAAFAGVSAFTIRNWCATFHIGRRMVGGRWRVSKPALQMLIDNDRWSLNAISAANAAGTLPTTSPASVSLGDVSAQPALNLDRS